MWNDVLFYRKLCFRKAKTLREDVPKAHSCLKVSVGIKQKTYEKHTLLIGLYYILQEKGFEPSRCHQRWILSPLRLPFRHSCKQHKNNITDLKKKQVFFIPFLKDFCIWVFYLTQKCFRGMINSSLFGIKKRIETERRT